MAQDSTAWRRDRQVNIRLNDYEWKTIENNANMWGCSPVEYMRLVATDWGAARVHVMPTPRTPGVGRPSRSYRPRAGSR